MKQRTEVVLAMNGIEKIQRHRDQDHLGISCDYPYEWPW